MITPRIGRRVRAQRRTRAAVVFALAAALITAPLLTSVSPAVADENTTEEGTLELSLTAGVHGVVQPGAPLLTTVTIDNAAEEDLSAGQVTVELNRTALADSAALAAWLDSGDAPGLFTPLGSEESEAVAAADTSTTSVLTPVGLLGALPAGVYPIRVSFAADAGAYVPPSTAQSVLIVEGEAAAQVTVLVPITATPADGGLLTAEELTALTAPDGALTAQLDGVAGTSAVLAVDPLIPAAIRALGAAAPLAALNWLDRLEVLPNERFALQAGDADATAQARAGLPNLLTPLSLTSYLNPADFAEKATPTPTPSPTSSSTPTTSPMPSAPVLPTDDELMSIARETPAILWPTAGLDTADLTTFNEWMSGDATTILPSTAISAPTGAVVDVDGSSVLVMNSAVSSALSNAAAEIDDAAREPHIAEGIAHLALTGPAASLLVGLDRDETRTADALRETILSVSAIADPTGFNALRAGSSGSATLHVSESDAADSVARASLLTDLIADEGRLTDFSTILDDPLVLLSPERLQMLRMLGVGKADAYVDAVATHQKATTATLDAVGVQPPSPIQLFTSAAPLPVWVRNDLPWPVNVQLTAKPSDARLNVRPVTDVLAQPASNTRVKVPVEARVGSGSLDVHFALNSPTGVQIGTDQTALVTVRAEWENIGLGVLGGIIALLLVLGVVRTVVRRRKDRADAATDAGDAGGSPASGE